MNLRQRAQQLLTEIEADAARNSEIEAKLTELEARSEALRVETQEIIANAAKLERDFWQRYHELERGPSA